MIRDRRAFALPTVVLLLGLLGLLAAGTLVTLRGAQRNASLRFADLELAAATTDAAARALDACPESLLDAIPGTETALDVPPSTIGEVEAGAVRLAGRTALVHGQVRDRRASSPASEATRRFRFLVRLRPAPADSADSAAAAGDPACERPIRNWATGPTW